MPVIRTARSGAVALALLIAPSATLVAPGPASAAAGKRWHRQVTLGVGKRAVKVYTCTTGTGSNYTAWFRMITRSSTDRSYPRVEIDLAEGSQTANRETALMPGNRAETFRSGTWTAAGAATIKVYNQGKRKTKHLTVGAFGAC